MGALAAPDAFDAELEARAEERARELLRSCVNAEEWATYEAHGLIRVYPQANRSPTAAASDTATAYAYLIYPHKPIVAYVVESGRLLGEYCVAFGSPRLPPSDDVLAKWLALTGDERGLLARAAVHPVGRQIDPERVRRDLGQLAL
ncbi:MAG TPA: hypothetical protein VHM72_08500 [Solirubrobacteraceae bacterium]|nr:hypothetical protein [Solirubrobacteraceae bacterium]